MEEKFVRKGFIFSKHIGLIHLADLRVLKHFSTLSLPFSHFLSLFSLPRLFSLLNFSLHFFFISVDLFSLLLLSCGVAVCVAVWFVGVVVCRCGCGCGCGVLCGTLKTPVCTFKTSPCVPAPRPCQKKWTCGTHGDVLNVHTEAF